MKLITLVYVIAIAASCYSVTFLVVDWKDSYVIPGNSQIKQFIEKQD
jgi:hypothetical protein